MLEQHNYWTRRLKRRRFLGAVGMGTTAAVIATACGGGGEDKATRATPGAPGASPAAGQAGAGKQLASVKVGGFIDRSGATANIGTILGDGTLAWVEYANAENLIGRKVEWPEIDHSYQVNKAQEGYKRFVEQDKVATILSFGTPITTALTPASGDDKIPLWTPGFGNSEAADGSRFPYLFVGVASYHSQAMALLGHVKDSWQDTSRRPKVIYMYYDNDAGRDPLDLVKAQAPKLNIDLLATIAVPATTTDMSQQMLDVKSRDPDFVLTHFFGAIPALSLKAAQQVGFPASKMYSFVWGGAEQDFEAAGPAAEGYYNLHFTAHPSDNPEALQRLRDYWKRTGKPPEDTRKTGNIHYMRGIYNAAIIMEAIRLAGDKDKLTGEDVKKGAESMKDFKAYGLSPGTTLTKEDHAGSRKVRLYQVKGGKNTLVKDWFEGPKPS